MKKWPLLLILLLPAACAWFEDYTGIKWDTSFRLPLMNRIFYAREMITSDPTHFDSTATGQVYFHHTQDLEHDANQAITASDLYIRPVSYSGLPLPADSSVTLTIPLYYGSGVSLSSGTITSGTLHVELTNKQSAFGALLMRFDNLLTSENTALVISGNSDFTWQDVDLTGYRLASYQDTYLNELTATVTAFAGTGRVVTLANLNASLTGTQLNNVYGRVHNKTINCLNNLSNLDYEYPGNFTNAVRLHHATAQFEMYNEIGFPLIMQGRITSHAGRDSLSMVLPAADSPEALVIPAAISNTEASHSFLNELDMVPLFHDAANDRWLAPESISLDGIYFVVKDETDGFCRVNASAYGMLHTKIYLEFSFTGEVLRPAKRDTLDISKDNQDLLDYEINNAVLHMQLKNRYQQAGQVRAYFCTDNDNLYNMTDTPIPEGFRVYGTATAANGTQPSDNDIQINLNKTQIDFFKNNRVYCGLELLFPATDEVHNATADDYISIQGHVDFDLVVEGE